MVARKDTMRRALAVSLSLSQMWLPERSSQAKSPVALC